MEEIVHFQAEKTFRYATFGDASKAKLLLIALHGYGQLVPYFIKKFDAVDEAVFVVVPEGPHRFYLNGTSGRVGASWMTKEDRESDIYDNLNWLQKMYKQLSKNNTFEKIVLLGFSQGGATAARWYSKHSNQFDHFISWAAVFPPDVEFQINNDHKQHFFVLGKQDQYFQNTNFDEAIISYEKLGFQIHLFDGVHDIVPSVLNEILEVIND
ncbi:MAG: hypothetical protein RL264_13 [Bacteroidota bacterium]|jgi:predicted esterase